MMDRSSSDRAKSGLEIAILTKEWPPQVYGGAGVHVANLVPALRTFGKIEGSVNEVAIHCFDGPRADAHGYQLEPSLTKLNPSIAALLIDASMLANLKEIDIAHSHTWYANFAGDLAKRTFDIPHVITAHSLEPRRPWKAEQLGAGYQISSWIESTCYKSADAIIAVSDGMRDDVMECYPFLDSAKVVTIRNGIDSERFQATQSRDFLERNSITGNFILFVGRITRQKGLAHLLRAFERVPKEVGLVIAAGNPDEPGIGKEIEVLVASLKEDRGNLWWFPEMLPHDDLLQLLSAADIFVCPSIYEPLGIVNLEAMACNTAVVATAVGGIPEVVMHGVTGDLVPWSENPHDFEEDLATTITSLMQDQQRRDRYAKAGRERVVREFGWENVAKSTLSLYQSLRH